MYKHREFCQTIDKEIIVEEPALDIFYTDNTPKIEWKPEVSLKPYDQLTKVVLDIETTGLDKERDRIIAIGCMTESGNTQIFMQLDEALLLQEFLDYLQSVNPEVLLTYNGMAFDLPFIITRLNALKIKHPFKQARNSRRIPSAQIFGTPIEVNEILYKNTNHVDAYICVLRWDFIAKSLTLSYSLKNVVLELGLRKERRLTLSHQQIQECWHLGEGSSGWETIREYLQFDLEDTKLIADKLVPSYWYEALIVPGMNLQQLALAGNATKWQRVLENQYPHTKPKADPKMKFAGGLVISVPGLHRNVAKIDVSSLYPSIMLKYGICSRKDEKRIALGILKYLTEERLKMKAKGKLGDVAAKQAEGALKVLINSLFGFYGTGGVGFNDMEAAALVTAYGRRILQHMISVIESVDGIQIESDTDGVFFSHPQPELVFQTLSNSMPSGISIELETTAKAMFVPAKGAKNYILWHYDGSTTLKGIWKKRDRSRLEKEFPVNYLTYFITSEQQAEDYYNEVKRQILSGQLPKEEIQITRKIKANERALLTLGKRGEIVTFYHGMNGVTATGEYAVSYYLNLIAKKRDEIRTVLKVDNSATYKQLSLF
ncbi:ribonuclease H-like domain-containing protein [Planktothrix sp. FACHB-1355]|uniref:DNA-directed DNA polymerase n=1 Tax=Aerosakkonema funiforme FACHB-1375 TaxID=2949571 RepID=A0A926VC12_9CYAN|nr:MULTISPECIES: 3'-5' exonuclease [Oscillatoriales]MBD2181033.1 ribonuclease H-like domain-containing protein [Aerosakkonema funiforme FACHB-1375]MBD3557933.1 ribonuclease H-like domain-containing protein [Planktothrix sp. FACHB-1355]